MLRLLANRVIVYGRTISWFPQLIPPRADGCNLQVDKFKLKISCVLVRDEVISQLTNHSHRFLFSWSLYINIYFLYIFLHIYKKKKSCNSSFRSEFGDGIIRLWDHSIPSDLKTSTSVDLTQSWIWSCFRFPWLLSVLNHTPDASSLWGDRYCYMFIFLSTAKYCVIGLLIRLSSMF